MKPVRVILCAMVKLLIMGLILPGQLLFAAQTKPTMVVAYSAQLNQLRSIDKEIRSLVDENPGNWESRLRAKFPASQNISMPQADFVIATRDPIGGVLLRRITMPSHRGTPQSVLRLIESKGVPINTSPVMVANSPHSQNIDTMSAVEFVAFNGNVLKAVLASIPADYPTLAANITLRDEVLQVKHHGPTESTPRLPQEEIEKAAIMSNPLLGQGDLSDPVDLYPELREDSGGIAALNAFAKSWNIRLLVEQVENRPLSYAEKLALTASKATSSDTVSDAVTELALILDHYAVQTNFGTDRVVWVAAANRTGNLFQHPASLEAFSGPIEKLPGLLERSSVFVSWPRPLDFDPFPRDQRSMEVQGPKSDTPLGEYFVKNLPPALIPSGVVCALTYAATTDQTIIAVQRVNGKLITTKKKLTAVMTLGCLQKEGVAK